MEKAAVAAFSRRYIRFHKVEPLHLSARAPAWYNEPVFQGGVS